MMRWGLALLVFPLLILLHLYVAPYTKVEESFNIQAIHDLLTYGIPSKDVGKNLKVQYDHMTFPGAVPRTFVGALLLAGFSRPLIWLNAAIDRQRLGEYDGTFSTWTLPPPTPDASFANIQPVRSVLGLLNAASFIIYAIGVRKAFGTTVSLWYIALQASQFHIIYYASRTLPNMFAFGITTLALRFLLPDQISPGRQLRRVRLAIYLITLTTVVFRSEIAILIACHGLYLLFRAFGNGLQPQIALIRNALLPAGFFGVLIGLAISVPIDTFFWQSPTPLWPEFSAFISNVFPSDSSLGASAWGTSPWHWYFTSALPRLLLDPICLPLIAYTLTQPATRQPSFSLLLPNIGYILLYSILPHKETRFLFPILPPLTTAAALAASYITHRRHRSVIFRLVTYTLILCTLATFLIAHGVLLPLSALSYPGAHALNTLHAHAPARPTQHPSTIAVHLDNLALQTGVTRFLQMPPPVKLQARNSISSPVANMTNTHWVYDKSDDPAQLLDPLFWEQFDYAIMEDPGLAIGAWEVVERVYGLGKARALRPDQERGPTQPGRGLAGVIEEVYGRGMAMGYCLLRDVVREGKGLHRLLGGRPSLTAGWWVDVDLVEKLFVLRVERIGSLEVGGG